MVRLGDTELGEFPLFLAPMEDITDSPFRSICKSFGADVMITEFIAADGLIRDGWRSRLKTQFEETERPLGIQIFGNNIDSMVEAAKMAAACRPDFIDLNFGCPVRKIVMKGGGAALLQDIPKMVAMAAAVVKSTRLPVTAKTRLGWDEQHKEIVDIAERLQDAGIRMITIHGRTRAQLYGGHADWTLIGQVKNNPRMMIPVIGNGDIDSGPKALEMKERYGVDGLMIGRAATGNPWIFQQIKAYLQQRELILPPSTKERIRVLRLHLGKSVPYKGERATLLEFRKQYTGYFKGLPGFKQHRMRLVTADSLEKVEEILKEIEYSASEI
ncbi:MAG TPA: tRNA dihydrouridine synthase DusB [Bacteroidales bacterium]|nr:tRNA dihydrouridine synthase DusB [Bacteroidales bacterium]